MSDSICKSCWVTIKTDTGDEKVFVRNFTTAKLKRVTKLAHDQWQAKNGQRPDSWTVSKQQADGSYAHTFLKRAANAQPRTVTPEEFFVGHKDTLYKYRQAVGFINTRITNSTLPGINAVFSIHPAAVIPVATPMTALLAQRIYTHVPNIGTESKICEKLVQFAAAKTGFEDLTHLGPTIVRFDGKEEGTKRDLVVFARPVNDADYESYNTIVQNTSVLEASSKHVLQPRKLWRRCTDTLYWGTNKYVTLNTQLLTEVDKPGVVTQWTKRLANLFQVCSDSNMYVSTGVTLDDISTYGEKLVFNSPMVFDIISDNALKLATHSANETQLVTAIKTRIAEAAPATAATPATAAPVVATAAPVATATTAATVAPTP